MPFPICQRISLSLEMWIYVTTVFLFLFVSLFCFAEHFVLITIQLLSKDMVSSLVKKARKYCFLKNLFKSTQAAWKCWM